MLTHIPTDFVVTNRGGVVENRHSVHAAIVDAHGRLLYAVGDPSRTTLARSAAKPAQAVAILETGAFDQFDLDDADLALTCASHSSEERHITRARNMLAKIHAREEDLRCGGRVPVSTAVQRAWIKADFDPTPVCSNCSGKHAGMIAAAKALGTEIDTYHLPTHPLQRRVQKTVDEICGLGENVSKWGIDGCNLPAPAFPLHRLARMYAAFAEAAQDPPSKQTDTVSREQALSRVFHAMAQYPELVAGDDRFCTVLMKAFRGSLIGKLGADGCYGIGVQASDRTRQLGAAGAIGIAVKIEDGNIGILYSAVTEILEQLQIGDAAMRQGIAQFHRPDIKNTVGVITGYISHTLEVRPVQ